jgi:hypothetical protein
MNKRKKNTLIKRNMLLKKKRKEKENVRPGSCNRILIENVAFEYSTEHTEEMSQKEGKEWSK